MWIAIVVQDVRETAYGPFPDFETAMAYAEADFGDNEFKILEVTPLDGYGDSK
jgi:hypothetical protein